MFFGFQCEPNICSHPLVVGYLVLFTSNSDFATLFWNLFMSDGCILHHYFPR